MKCPDGQTNWWCFILVRFGPLTIFYVLVVLFNINVTSSRLQGVVWFSQMGSIPAFVRFMLASLKIGNYLLQLKIAKVFFVFYSFWNLDVLRSVIPDTCLNVSTVQMITLDYLIALYPFALVLLSYIIIKVQLLLFLAYGLTLSSMFFIYAIILLIIYMIALINIEPYKKIASNYIPTDLIFFYFLSFIYITILGREYSSMERNVRFHAILTVA